MIELGEVRAADRRSERLPVGGVGRVDAGQRRSEGERVKQLRARLGLDAGGGEQLAVCVERLFVRGEHGTTVALAPERLCRPRAR